VITRVIPPLHSPHSTPPGISDASFTRPAPVRPARGRRVFFPVKRRWRLLLSGVAVLGLAGCATLSDQERAELRRHRVSPALYETMTRDRVLTLAEIVELSRKRVPDNLIVHYIEETESVYTLRTDDVTRLRRAGVSKTVIDYLLQTPALYATRLVPFAYPYPEYTSPPVVIIERRHR
jgi:hypothetical protein